MQQIDMSNEKPMGIAENALQVRYSAAYPMGAERFKKWVSDGVGEGWSGRDWFYGGTRRQIL